MTNNNHGFIFLDEKTNFDGDIEAERVIIEGRVNGSVHAEQELLMKKGAYIEGQIHTKNFSADNGSSCNVEMHIEEGEKADQESNSSTTDEQGTNEFFTKFVNLFLA